MRGRPSRGSLRPRSWFPPGPLVVSPSNHERRVAPRWFDLRTMCGGVAHTLDRGSPLSLWERARVRVGARVLGWHHDGSTSSPCTGGGHHVRAGAHHVRSTAQGAPRWFD